MECPICHDPGCEELADEVDIGVGVQRYVYGYECPACGTLIRQACCGRLGDEHESWCNEAKGN